jgi:hypothetical protein
VLAIHDGVLTLTATEQVHKTLVFWTHQSRALDPTEIGTLAHHKPFPVFKVQSRLNLMTSWTEHYTDWLLDAKLNDIKTFINNMLNNYRSSELRDKMLVIGLPI